MYSLSQIANIVRGTLHGDGSKQITLLCTDTRRVQNGQTSLFVALETITDNGHHYLAQARQQDITACLVSRQQDVMHNSIVVANTMDALQKLATHHQNEFDIPIIGITGSNGKTIVKEWIAHLLQDDFTICKNPKSFNSQLGVPLSVWQLNSTHTLGIFEAGISNPNEMKKLANIIKPTVGIFTHLGDAHSIHFGSNKEKLREKLLLFNTCETIVCSTNQPEVLQEINTLDKNTFTWGSNILSDVHIVKNIEENYTITYQSESYSVSLEHTDKASINNCFTSLCAAIALGQNIEKALDKLVTVPKIDLRLQQVTGLHNNDLILDYYNTDLQSTAIALDFLGIQNTKEKTTVILSDILQSNLDDGELYSQLNKLIIHHKIDQLIGIGNRISAASDVFEIPAVYYANTQDFLLKHPIHDFSNQSILLKGAREFKFEEIAERLRVKTHQTTLEVNLTRLKYNIDVIRQKIGIDTKIMAMVKALAYGNGGYQIAKLLENNNIDYLGVAYTDEATELRASGISLPIVVLNPDLDDLSPYHDYNIQPVIYSFSSLDKVSGTDLKIHIEFDTGMHRLGFVSHDTDKLIAELKKSPSLQIVSMFSHLATADEASLDDFTRRQIDDFEEVSKKIEEALQIETIKHIANSAATERIPLASLDMVRIGIGIYGISANSKSQLLPVSTFKSYISQIKIVPAGDGIGYGQHSKSHEDRTIAVVAVGYADGYNRLFSQGKGVFYINGKPAPVLGNVCMDMTMCNVSGIDCKEGDEVVIFGNMPTVEQVAKSIDTIPYEILTNVSERVNRVFYQE